MGKHKLIRISEQKLRTDAHTAIKKFIDDRYIRNKTTSLKHIQEEFQKPPYELSEGTVINYLNELLEKRKISTWKQKNRRYYGPPQIPLPIKVGIAVSTVIIGISVLIDMFIPPTFVYQYIYMGLNSKNMEIPTSTMLPIMCYMLLITVFFTLVWYSQYQKLYK